jgi:hypothetical protein
MSDYTTKDARAKEIEQIVQLAREAGLLVTLDGRIGRETYQSVAGSLASFLRFVDALRGALAEKEVV